MIVFPFAKINLGLHVLRRREDGYHEIESVLVPIGLHDALEAVIDPSIPGGKEFFVRTGMAVPGEISDDLCLRALRLLREGRKLPGLRIHLHKAIPTGAGLGGGSSDAAHLLLLLNALLDMELTKADLHSMAGTLGSDCPFFLEQKPQMARGRGDKLHSVEIDLQGKWLLLINPGIHVPTADVYRNIKPSRPQVDLLHSLSKPLSTWQNHVNNDMEKHVISLHPTVGEIKQRLLDSGALYAAMSGSGSSVFGIFNNKTEQTQYHSGCLTWQMML